MQKLFRFLIHGFLFLLVACDASTQKTSRQTLALDADAGEEPASWEGDWTWEDPVTGVDAGTLVADAGIGTNMDNAAPLCHGTTLRISVSTGLIADCHEGLIIHAWGKDGEEHLSAPDTTLTLELGADWRGWIAFNVTCGETWAQTVDWRPYLNVSLDERGLIAASSGGHALTAAVKLCPFATDGSAVPVIPLVCGENPC